jgi:hypothetical protein
MKNAENKKAWLIWVMKGRWSIWQSYSVVFMLFIFLCCDACMHRLVLGI